MFSPSPCRQEDRSTDNGGNYVNSAGTLCKYIGHLVAGALPPGPGQVTTITTSTTSTTTTITGHYNYYFYY